jgi:threonine/homoserine efflux transporter RhtA
MEYISIHFLFMIVQVLCVSSIPLGRRSIRIIVKLFPKQFGVMVGVNFAIATLVGWLFGATTLIVIEAIGILIAVLILCKDDGTIKSGIQQLEEITKVRYLG